jgi:hypothetical protein
MAEHLAEIPEQEMQALGYTGGKNPMQPLRPGARQHNGSRTYCFPTQDVIYSSGRAVLPTPGRP